MISSLIPEKQLSVSPALAATIGLEEAVLLGVLHELFTHRAQGGWARVEEAALQDFVPFWPPQDIQRIVTSLRDKGIVQVRSAPLLSGHVLDFSLLIPTTQTASQPAPSPRQPEKTARSGGSANLIADHWQPDDELSRQISMLGIPADFVSAQIPPFVRYWREQGVAHHAWGSRFLKEVLRNWRTHETHETRKSQLVPMSDGWQPGINAMEILLRDGIQPELIADSVAEFVLFWRDKGNVSNTWDSTFIKHIRRQWAIFTAKLVNDPTPRPMASGWQPSNDVYDILQLANIDADFARAQLPEFVLYWLDSKQVHSSWNSKFLHNVKYRWAKRHQLPWQGETDGFIEKHTDSSWRESL